MKTPGSVTLKKLEKSAQSRRANVGAIDGHRSGAPHERAKQKWELKHILVPTDFSKSSNKALRHAVSLAGKIGSQITLVHVIKPRPIELEPYPVMLGVDPRLSKANDTLRQVCRVQHVDPSLLRNTLVREGTPHREITDAARELEADLIIIATNGRTGLARVLLGSTTERVVRHAPCPVLVIREKEREFIHN